MADLPYSIVAGSVFEQKSITIRDKFFNHRLQFRKGGVIGVRTVKIIRNNGVKS